MRTSLLFLALLIAPLASAQSGTFTFSTATVNSSTTAVTETVSGVTLTITATGGGANSLDAYEWGDWAGTNGVVVSNRYGVTSFILSFDSPVNIASLRLADGDGDGELRTFIVTPSAGPSVTFSDSGDTGATIAPAGGFVGVTSLTLTLQGGGDFFLLIDDIVMDGSLPVELTTFAATADGADALLRWETASETNNAGFEVQVDAGAGFAAAGWISGHGTTLEAQRYAYRTTNLTPGTYRFRLKQVDFDGAFQFSPEVELTLAPQGYALTAPSTFAGSAEARLLVERPQHVRVVLYDVAGREVQVLHAGVVAEARVLPIRAEALPSGVYFLRATGETFTATRRIVRVR